MNQVCMFLVAAIGVSYSGGVDIPGAHVQSGEARPPMNRESLEKWLKDHKMEALHNESGDIVEVRCPTRPNPFEVGPPATFNRNVVRGLAALPKLEKLDLRATSLKDEYFANVKGFAQLKELRLDNTNVSGAVLRAFGDSKNLELLSLYDTGDVGKSLDAIPADSLTTLYVGGPRIGDQTLRTIARFRNLRKLTVRSPLATAEGVLSLGQSVNAERLAVAAPVDYAVFDQLTRLLPNCACIFERIGSDEAR